MTINLNPNQSGGALSPSVVRPQDNKGFQKASMRDFERETTDFVIAVFADHQAAEAAIKKLAEDGFAMKHLSIIGKGYHTEEKVVGFWAELARWALPCAAWAYPKIA